jgi:hypothetical protein
LSFSVAEGENAETIQVTRQRRFADSIALFVWSILLIFEE